MGRCKKTEMCPFAGDGLSGKWKFWIIYHLLSGTKRFGELQRLVPDISRQMLTTQLRELETIGIVGRRAYSQALPRVDYFLTPAGRQFAPIVFQVYEWGARNTAQAAEQDWMLTFGGKWTFWIWYVLTDGPRRFGELQQILPAASRQMLSRQLHKLQHIGVLKRCTCDGPSKPVYVLTEFGMQAAPLLQQMVQWSRHLCDQLGLEYVYPLNPMVDGAPTP